MSDIESCIVQIQTVAGIIVGAGFLAAEDKVVTCAHVVGQAVGQPDTPFDPPQDNLRLIFPFLDATATTARVIHWRPSVSEGIVQGDDIAVLRLDTEPPAGARPARLILADDLAGHPFRSCGFPVGYDSGVWAYGILRDRLPNGWRQIEDIKEPGMRIQPGYSGAPVWDNEAGGVVGMVVASAEAKIAFVIPIEVLVTACPAVLHDQTIPPCPYRGLAAFQEKDAPLFFGRESFAEQLAEAVVRRPLLAVVGASGSGKSSIVFAGLLPRLRREIGWNIASFRPGERPFHALAASLVPFLVSDLTGVQGLAEANRLANYFIEGKVHLRDVAEQVSRWHPDTPHLLLVADQLEELYTLCPDNATRRRFLDELLRSTGSEVLKLVLTLRGDFYGQVLAYRPFADALQDAVLNLGPMDQGESRQAVEGPARKVGLTFEPGLVKRILDDLGDEPGHLPLLEFALTELWSRQEDGRLTHAAYDEIGRAQGALAWRAETVYASLSTDERARVQRIFVQLVCPGEGTEDTRRRATQMELGDAAWPLVQRLADERLVTTGRDRASGQPTVEVAHEALIRSWTRLRAWVEADRAFRTWQERLRAALRQWGATDKDEGALLRGAPLAEAKSWLVERGPDLGEEECAFIQTSLAEEKQRQQRELEQEREQRRKLLEKEAMVRHKLARDLHDGPTQTISAIAMRLNFIQMMFQKKQPADKIVEEVVKIEELARKTTREVRTMLFTLRPVVLETQGLAKALEQYADRLCQTEGLNVEVDPDGYDGQLSKQAESVVFAVVEEAVGNAKKHAQADHVLVRLRVESHMFTAEIQDDGIGFDVETAQRRREVGHMGLLNMEERAELVGGRCSVQSQPGAGTLVRLEIPWRQHSSAE